MIKSKMNERGQYVYESLGNQGVPPKGSVTKFAELIDHLEKSELNSVTKLHPKIPKSSLATALNIKGIKNKFRILGRPDGVYIVKVAV